ncbi:MAG: hypothetical protein M0P31_15330 [Solirubrobacteraceae bacterium]|nr:hypothetical protein [Solirubrobacteraceae bacterium]
MIARSVVVALGLLLAVPSAAVAVQATPKNADRAAIKGAQAQHGPGRTYTALCNPERSERTNRQLKSRWFCTVRATATTEDVATYLEPGDPLPADERPMVTAFVLGWADGEFEAFEADELYWAPREDAPKPLGMVTARRRVWQAMKQEGFPGRKDMAGQRLRCRRSTRFAVRCTLGWAIGDTTGVHRIRVANTRDGEWEYSWKATVVDEYCLYVMKRPRSRCIRRDRVR